MNHPAAGVGLSLLAAPPPGPYELKQAALSLSRVHSGIYPNFHTKSKEIFRKIPINFIKLLST